MTGIGYLVAPWADIASRRSVAQADNSSNILVTLLILALFLTLSALPAPAAPPPANTILLGGTSDTVEIVRCHFDEGRIVVRHAGKLHVLREGETLDSTGLGMVEITPDAATLAIRQDSPLGSLRLFRVTGTTSGALLIREYATDPDALAGGSVATAQKAPVSRKAPGKPKSNSNGY